MVIVTGHYATRDGGAVLSYTYSDTDMMIECDGVLYSKAIDKSELNRQYAETGESVKAFFNLYGVECGE